MNKFSCIFLAVFGILFLLASEPSIALSLDHPANPAAGVKAFQPMDYFSPQQMPVVLAEVEHQHEAVDTPSTDEHDKQGKSCKRKEGDGCCCCKCCDKSDAAAKEGMKCMRNMKPETDHDEGKPGCDMMKKDTSSEGGSAKPEADSNHEHNH